MANMESGENSLLFHFELRNLVLEILSELATLGKIMQLPMSLTLSYRSIPFEHLNLTLFTLYYQRQITENCPII